MCRQGHRGRERSPDDEVAARYACRMPAFVLSGPSFAADVARGLPTAVTLAGFDLDTAKHWADALAASDLPHLSSATICAASRSAVRSRMCSPSPAASPPARARRQRPGRAHHPRLRRTDALRQGARRPARNADRSFRPRRSPPHLLEPAIAQFFLRPRAGRRQGRSPKPLLWPRAWSRASPPRPIVARSAQMQNIDMPICDAVHAVIDGGVNPERRNGASCWRARSSPNSIEDGDRMLYALICTDKPDALDFAHEGAARAMSPISMASATRSRRRVPSPTRPASPIGSLVIIEAKDRGAAEQDRRGTIPMPRPGFLRSVEIRGLEMDVSKIRR